MYVCMYVCMFMFGYSSPQGPFVGMRVLGQRGTFTYYEPGMYVCMYVCMYVMHVCMSSCMHVGLVVESKDGDVLLLFDDSPDTVSE